MIVIGNIYGTIESPIQDETNFSGKVVFNKDDAIRHNGYVAYVSIAFFQGSNSPNISLYVISPTMDIDCFQVIYRYRIPKGTNSNDFNQEKIVLPDSTVYLETGQFLAIGFDSFSGSPKHVANRKHYALCLNQVDAVYGTNRAVKFDKGNLQVAFSFHLVPTQGKSFSNSESINIMLF